MSAVLAGSGFAEAPVNAEQRGIPFDYSFVFPLQGRADRTVSATVKVSVEAPFVARSIGYGLIPSRPRVQFGVRLTTPPPTTKVGLLDVLGLISEALMAKGGWPLVESVLRSGLKLNPETADLVLGALLEGRMPTLTAEAGEKLFEASPVPPGPFTFEYALYDQGSGRAFQSDPILSTAGLGTADGDRPFREFVPAITFAPQSTIRMDVTEVTPHAGTLYVALHGYKVLGGSGTPTDLRRLRRRARR